MSAAKPKEKILVSIDRDAWWNGFEAGRKRESCVSPYGSDSDKGHAWVSGYIEGKAQPSEPRESK